MRKIKLRLEPVQHLKKNGAEWIVEGDDPQFLIHWRLPRTLPTGNYTLTASRESGLLNLSRPSLYFDSGAGFNEGERTIISFQEISGRVAARVRIESPVSSIRFDPSDGDERPAFGVEYFELTAQKPTNAATSANSPRVLLNLVRLLPGDAGAGGAGRVCLAYVRELPKHVTLRVAIPPYHSRLAADHPNVSFVVVASDGLENMEQHLAWCDVYIDPLNALRPKLIPSHAAVLAMLHDLQQMRLPQFFSKEERRRRAAEYGYAVGRADNLIAISEYERENLRYFYGREDVSVVHHAPFMAEDSGLSEEDIRAWRARAKERRYLIYPSVPWLHKNHEVLVQALAILRRRGVNVPVILTNTRGKAGHGDRISSLAQSLGVDDLVKREQFLPERELLELTLDATGMVFPSLYEGFGIPLADAMRLGVPILAARCGGTPEVCGAAAAYFSQPQNAIAVAEDIEAFWNDEEARSRLAEEGLVRSSRYSSTRVGSELADAIAKTIARKRSNIASADRTKASPSVPFRPLSVCVVCGNLSHEDRNRLANIGDIKGLFSVLFGPDVPVTVCLDINLLTEDNIYSLFRAFERVICFDESKFGSLELAINDFSLRYDDGDLHIVTKFATCIGKYSPLHIRALKDAMLLHPDADYATWDVHVRDYVLQGIPGEIEGVLEYERRRRIGPVVFDAALRRDAISAEPHGTFSYLAALATRARRLLIPEALPQ